MIGEMDAGELVLRQARGASRRPKWRSGARPARTSTSCWPRYDVEDADATCAVTINPLVNWIWLGFGVLAFGTGIALLPERAFLLLPPRRCRPRRSRPALMLLLLLLPAASSPSTSQGPTPSRSIPKTPLERELQHEIICMCGDCGRQRLADASAPRPRRCGRRLAGLVAKGKTREQIYDYFIAQYGSQEPLAAPIDKGFNRLAWALPYVVGAVGRRDCSAWSPFAGPVATPRLGSLAGRRDVRRWTTRRCASDWTMSSEISTRPAEDPGFHASHFFVLLSLLAATVAVVLVAPERAGASHPHQPDDRRRRGRRRRASTACSRRWSPAREAEPRRF